MTVAMEREHFPTEAGYDTKLESGQDLDEDKLFGCANPQLSRWLVSDNQAGEEAKCGGPGLT